MTFTYSETFGEKRISEWVVPAMQRFVREKHGLDIEVSIQVKDNKSKTNSLKDLK